MLDGGIFSFIMLIVLISLIVVIVFVIEDDEDITISNLWVAAGEDSGGEKRKNLIWSESGKIWNHSSGAGDKFDELGNSVAYGKDIWVAGG